MAPKRLATLQRFPAAKQPLIVLTTFSSFPEARRFARVVIQKRLAGCVNLLPGIESWYRWQGKVEHGKEILLFIKTSSSKLRSLADFLKRHHSYELPELVVLPISWAESAYAKWLFENV